MHLLASFVLVLVALAEAAGQQDAGLQHLELKFQNELDNSTIIKLPMQPQVFKCQVRLLVWPTSARARAVKTSALVGSQEGAQLSIDWLKDERPIEGQVSVINVELKQNSSNLQVAQRPDRRNKFRIEIKNTANPSQLKLTSRLKLSRLQASDSGRYKCRARALLPATNQQLRLDSNGPTLMVNNGSVAGK